MLCEGCQELFRQVCAPHPRQTKRGGRPQAGGPRSTLGNDVKRGNFHPRFIEPPHAVTDSRMACEFCAYIVLCALPVVGRENLLQMEYHFQPAQGNPWSELDLWRGPPRKEERLLSFEIIHTSEAHMLKDQLQKITTDTTGAEGCIKQLRSWMETCETKHAVCQKLQKGSNPDWHPTRLICTSENRIRLVDDHSTLIGATYCTLSYCWGRHSAFLKLQANNIESFRNEIPLFSMPRTFQDAITLSRSLEVPYIWIDALCIIQDSVNNKDWIQESVTMSDIYSRSSITFAASASESVHGGLFQERNLEAAAGMIVNPDGDNEGGYFIYPRNDWFSDCQFMPLNKRAWALQERRLSTRIAHFTSKEILWECCELCVSETSPQGRPLDENKHFMEVHPRFAALRNSQQLSEEEIEDSWWDFVWEYSKGSLTQKTDRLVAIAGVAKCFERPKSDTYLAGIWKRSLPQELLWCQVGDSAQIEGYIAPSWSWASIQAGATISKPRIVSYPCMVAGVIDSSISCVGDCFGAVTGGYIRLQGRICKAKIIRLQNTPIYGDPTAYWTLQLDNKITGTGAFRVWIDHELDKEGNEINMQDREVFCIEIAVRSEATGSIPSLDYNFVRCGLLLEPTGQNQGEFRRVGMYNAIRTFSYPSTWFRTPFRAIRRSWESGTCKAISLSDVGRWLMRPYNKNRRSRELAIFENALRRCDVADSNFEEFDGESKYTIKII